MTDQLDELFFMGKAKDEAEKPGEASSTVKAMEALMGELQQHVTPEGVRDYQAATAAFARIRRTFRGR